MTMTMYYSHTTSALQSATTDMDGIMTGRLVFSLQNFARRSSKVLFITRSPSWEQHRLSMSPCTTSPRNVLLSETRTRAIVEGTAAAAQLQREQSPVAALDGGGADGALVRALRWIGRINAPPMVNDASTHCVAWRLARMVRRDP